MTFRVSQAARAEAASVIRYYNSRPGRYGTAFSDEFDRALDRIEANPRIHAPAEDAPAGIEVREFFITRFDQRVIFRIDGEDVLVVTVVHASRRPGAWHSQLDAP